LEKNGTAIFTVCLCDGGRLFTKQSFAHGGNAFPDQLPRVRGIVFAFENSTLPGRLILLSLFIASVFSWTVMVTKFRVIRHAQRRREEFSRPLRTDRQPLRIYTDRVRFEGAPVFAIYKAGCKELTFQLLGSADVDETFRAGSTARKRFHHRRCAS